ncbi:MAG: nucleoside-diphosphate kinase [Patescibacteria group bacterium]
MDHETYINSLKRHSIDNRSALNAGKAEGKTPDEIEVETLEGIRLKEIVDLLNMRELHDLVHEGKLTLAGIKPNTQQTGLDVDSDDEGADMLRNMIQPPLEEIFSISLFMDSDDVEAFYGKELVDDLKQRPLEDGNVWEKYSKIMSAGPATFILLYDQNGNAVNEWRKQVGPTNLQKARDEHPNSIRGRFALETERNLVHGSSGLDENDVYNEGVMRENVGREIEWLRNRLTRRRIQMEKAA